MNVAGQFLQILIYLPATDPMKENDETFFVTYISGQSGDDIRISCVPHVKDTLSNRIQEELLTANMFNSLSAHDLDSVFETQDLHSTQLIKKIISYHLQILPVRTTLLVS